MIRVTIEVKYNRMTVHNGKLKNARLTWFAAGVEIYVVGTLQGGLYAQAANLAMNWCEDRHIPPRSLKSYNRSRTNVATDRGLTPEDLGYKRKKMF